VRVAWSISLLALSACATGGPVGGRHFHVERYTPFAPVAAPRAIPPGDEGPAQTLVLAPGSRESALSTARHLVGQTKLVINGKRYSDDCTGLVRAVFEPLGINLLTSAEQGDNGVTAMWRFAAKHGRIFEGGRPLPGDLAFFKETYDLNRDGHSNDGLTHIGVVEDVEADGTVIIIHRVARGHQSAQCQAVRRGGQTAPLRWRDGRPAPPLRRRQVRAGPPSTARASIRVWPRARAVSRAAAAAPAVRPWSAA
jgi:hypothetical protein